MLETAINGAADVIASFNVADMHAGAQRFGIHAPIIPAGFSYAQGDRWQVVLRFGTPVVPAPGELTDVVGRIEAEVQRLSTRPELPA